jgi:hypothetical protein
MEPKDSLSHSREPGTCPCSEPGKSGTHTNNFKIMLMYFSVRGPGSSVGIATDYGLEGPGIRKKIPVGARIFAHVHGAHPASCTMGTESFSGVKRPGRGVDYPPLSSAEVENE